MNPYDNLYEDQKLSLQAMMKTILFPKKRLACVAWQGTFLEGHGN